MASVPTSEENIVASAATSASYNMILQLAFRGITFFLNAFILRFISSETLGVVNVRLMLLYTTTLFLAREAFRRACLSKRKDQPWDQIVNIVWLTLPIGVLCVTILCFIWTYVFEQPNPENVPYYVLAVLAFGISTIIELLSEPLYVSSQILLFVRLKVLIEGVSLAMRCTITVTLILAFPSWGLLAFSLAQIMYTILYSSLYYVYFLHHIKNAEKDPNFPFLSVRDIFPKYQRGKPLFSFQTLTLAWSFFKQGILKQLLTEGERYVMTIFDLLSFSDQGVYDVINNLGSLAARFIFLPIEDSAYLLFSKTLTRGKHAKDSSKQAIELASQVLESLLKSVTLIGLTFLVFGYAYSYLLLDMYGGSMLSSGSGPLLLKTYSAYVLLIAINGVSEGFVFSVMSQPEVDKYNKKMLLFSVVFLLSSWFLTKLMGSIGFLFANCFNMTTRIAHSISYIHSYFEGSDYNPLQGLKVSLPVIASYLVSFIAMAFSESIFISKDVNWLQRILHIFIGGLCLLLTVVVIYISETKLLDFVKEHYNNRKSSSLPLKKDSNKSS